MDRSPFAGCLCATGSNPICPSDRHVPIEREPEWVRRARRSALPGKDFDFRQAHIDSRAMAHRRGGAHI